MNTKLHIYSKGTLQLKDGSVYKGEFEYVSKYNITKILSQLKALKDWLFIGHAIGKWLFKREKQSIRRTIS